MPITSIWLVNSVACERSRDSSRRARISLPASCFFSASVFAAPRLTQLVFVRFANGIERFYVDGVLRSSRVRTGDFSTWAADFKLTAGDELTVIAAVVIGGTSLFGGQGTIVGTFLGAALLTIVRNGLVQLGGEGRLQEAFLGGIIILAVLIHTHVGRRR